MGYKDRTWCVSKGCQNVCGRKFTQYHHEAAMKWWGGDNYPLSVAYFCDEHGNLIEDKQLKPSKEVNMIDKGE